MLDSLGDSYRFLEAADAIEIRRSLEEDRGLKKGAEP